MVIITHIPPLITTASHRSLVSGGGSCSGECLNNYSLKHFRYNWKQFAVVTSDIAGHDDFVQAVREEVSHMKEDLNIKYVAHFFSKLPATSPLATQKFPTL